MLQGRVAIVTGHRLLVLAFAISTKPALGLSPIRNFELVFESGRPGLGGSS